MSTPPGDDASHNSGGDTPPGRTEPVSLGKDDGAPGEAPFDPYRFGAPEHPVPPEYAPPGYVPPTPPPPQQAPPPPFARQQPGYGGYPSPYPPPPPGQGVQQYPRNANAKAIASLIFGIASIVLCWLTVFDLLPIIAAVVFGILGLNEAKRRGDGRGHGFAVAGIVCAVVGTILAVILSIYLYNKIEPCLDLPSGSSAQRTCIENQF